MFASDSSRSAGTFPGLTPLRPLWVRAVLLQASRVGGHGGRFSLRWWRRSERKKTAGQRGVARRGGTVRRSSQTKQTSLFFPRRVAKVGSAPRLNPLLMDAALPYFVFACLKQTCVFSTEGRRPCESPLCKPSPFLILVTKGWCSKLSHLVPDSTSALSYMELRSPRAESCDGRRLELGSRPPCFGPEKLSASEIDGRSGCLLPPGPCESSPETN